MITIMSVGASLAYEMFRVVDSTPAPTPRANTKMYLPGSNTWGAVTGVGAITLCNDLGAILAAAGLDDEVRIYDCGAGGSSIGFWANPSTNHWGVGGTARANALAQVAAAGVMPDIVIIHQGWQDYLYPGATGAIIRAAVTAGFDDLWAAFKSAWGSGLLINVWPPGRCNYPAPAADTAPAVQSAQIAWALSTAGAALGPSNYDMPLRDGVHGTGVGYETAGHRGAIALAAQLGIAGYAGIEMPRFTAASRWYERCLLETNAAALQPCDQWAPVSGLGTLTGFRVWDSAWGDVPVSGACIVGSKIRLDLAWVTGARIVYQRGIAADISRAIYTEIKGVRFALAPQPDDSNATFYV